VERRRNGKRKNSEAPLTARKSLNLSAATNSRYFEFCGRVNGVGNCLKSPLHKSPFLLHGFPSDKNYALAILKCSSISL
jgi:hypothetical protein